LAAVHFEHAGRRAEPNDEGVDVFPDELTAEPSDNLLARRGTTCHRSAKRCDSQDTHAHFSPKTVSRKTAGNVSPPNGENKGRR
jgi:hypothetical protein